MAKIIQNCWLSPYGEVRFCDDHDIEGKIIIQKYYPNESQDKDPREFLISKGWARFSQCKLMGCKTGWILPKRITTDQKNKIFDLTEEFLGDEEE